MFADDYRRLVVPDLEKLCRVQGLLLALDRRTFEQSVSAVMAEAARRGANLLPWDWIELPRKDGEPRRYRIQGIWYDLLEHIQCRVLYHEAEFRPSVIERRAVVDRVSADIDRHFG